MSDSIEATLAERGKTYGDFTDHAWVTQKLKNVMKAHPNWGRLEDIHKEALEMIVHKIGRVLNGNPNYADNWHDIEGYARLVYERVVSLADQKAEAERASQELQKLAEDFDLS